MSGSRTRRLTRNESGMALPMTLIIMSVITGLIVAFITFSQTEPVIAANQMTNAQARAIAESGVERALWALSKGSTTPGATGALADPLPVGVPAPYDGSQFVAVGSGGFVVTVANGAAANERIITATGYIPDNVNPIAVKRIQTTVTRVKWLDPPCAVCAGGEQPPGATTSIQVGGSASISASTSQGASHCAGVNPTAAAYSQGSVTTNGNPDLYAPAGGVAAATNQTNFSGFQFTDADMLLLKAMAQANGTYYQGAQTFSAPPPNGIIFVDTPSGNPFTASSPMSDVFTVDLHGNWGNPGWNGWLVVAGSIQISGNVRLNGLVYAQNDITLHGSGSGSIDGAVISTNRMDTSSTNIDTDDIGNAPITYNCQHVRNGAGTIPQNWFVKPGTYKELAGS